MERKGTERKRREGDGWEGKGGDRKEREGPNPLVSHLPALPGGASVLVPARQEAVVPVRHSPAERDRRPLLVHAIPALRPVRRLWALQAAHQGAGSQGLGAGVPAAAATAGQHHAQEDKE